VIPEYSAACNERHIMAYNHSILSVS
jgi:hypothetical protein